jgi:hypothetical protein
MNGLVTHRRRAPGRLARTGRRIPSGPLLLGGVLALQLLAAPAPAAATQPECGGLPTANAAEQIPTRVSQGCALFGRVAPSDRLQLGEREVRIADDGLFVLGIGRDATSPLHLTLTSAAGERRELEVEVIERKWKIERVDGVPPSTVDPPPGIAARIAREQARVVAARRHDAAAPHFAGGFDWPLRGRISGVYGSQRIYNGSPRSPHSGLDVAAPAGTPLRAPAAGVVTFADPDLYLTGGTVLIDHGHGLSSVFLHLSRIDVEVGQSLAQGEVFGAVGATGRATGPHMHWGVNWFDVRIDPALLPGIDHGDR